MLAEKRDGSGISEEILCTRIDQWLEENRGQMVQDLIAAASIPSVSAPPEGAYPYGKDCAHMLNAMCEISARAGFPFINHAYHCGTVEIPGQSEHSIGIFSHLDIVPPGNGWSFDPFSPFLKDGYIYGRGVTDDKGSAIASLYVLKCIRDIGLKLRHKVLAYFGCNEETTMSDILYYLARNPAPDWSLIPDARFSVCCGEKGIIKASIQVDLSGSGIFELAAGTVENIVPNYATMKLECQPREAAQLLAKRDLMVSFAKGVADIRTQGIAGHTAFPENTENALDLLANAARQVRFSNEKANSIIEMLAILSKGYLGTELGIATRDDFFGPLTSVCSTARVKDHMLTLTMNIRYPNSVRGSDLRAKLEQFCARYDARIVSLQDIVPSYVSPDNEVVQSINRLCGEVLQNEFQPYSMGGATYARYLPNALACGPLNKFLDRPGGCERGGGHQLDECICLESLENLIRIYVRAIVDIDRIWEPGAQDKTA